MLVAALLAHGARDLARVLEMSGKTKTSTKAMQKRYGLFQMITRHATLSVASPRCIRRVFLWPLSTSWRGSYQSVFPVVQHTAVAEQPSSREPEHSLRRLLPGKRLVNGHLVTACTRQLTWLRTRSTRSVLVLVLLPSMRHEQYVQLMLAGSMWTDQTPHTHS